MKNTNIFIIAYNRAKRFNIFKNEKQKNIIAFYLT